MHHQYFAARKPGRPLRMHQDLDAWFSLIVKRCHGESALIQPPDGKIRSDRQGVRIAE